MEENSIEKDINRCNKLADPINATWIGISNQLAIINILSDYKRVLKENEELKDTNCLVKRYFKLKDTNTYLQKENKKLKKSKITYEDVRDMQEKNKNIVDKKYISKQKVKDKIEEYKKESAELYRKFLESGESNNAMRDIRMICQAKAQVLQELIKEREE